jgi:hypothetical protein
MKWCHRAIRDKLKQMCEPFGIPLLETPAAYSSRFCSRTGVAGFRAVELSGDPLTEPKWRWRIRRPEDEKKETNDQKKRRENWELLFEMVKRANAGHDGESKGQQLRTLLVPDAGGSVFIPISKLNGNYQRPAKNPGTPRQHRPIIEFESVLLEENQKKQPRLIHADINAAVNLGLRAVTDPHLWSVHSRLRSERKFGNLPTPNKRKGKAKFVEPPLPPIAEVTLDRFWVSEREKRKFGEQSAEHRVEIVILSVARALRKIGQARDEVEKRRRLATAQGKVPKASDSRHPNFFADYANLWRTHWGAANLDKLPTGVSQPPHLVSGKALWGYVKGQSWKRCMVINAARLRAWGITPPKEWER